MRKRRAQPPRALPRALARRPEAIRLTTHNQASGRLACRAAPFLCRLWSGWPPHREATASSSSQRAALGAGRRRLATTTAQAAAHPHPARIASNGAFAPQSAQPSAALVAAAPGAVPSQCPTPLLLWLPRNGRTLSPVNDRRAVTAGEHAAREANVKDVQANSPLNPTHCAASRRLHKAASGAPLLARGLARRWADSNQR